MLVSWGMLSTLRHMVPARPKHLGKLFLSEKKVVLWACTMKGDDAPGYRHSYVDDEAENRGDTL